MLISRHSPCGDSKRTRTLLAHAHSHDGPRHLRMMDVPRDPTNDEASPPITASHSTVLGRSGRGRRRRRVAACRAARGPRAPRAARGAQDIVAHRSAPSRRTNHRQPKPVVAIFSRTLPLWLRGQTVWNRRSLGDNLDDTTAAATTGDPQGAAGRPRRRPAIVPTPALISSRSRRSSPAHRDQAFRPGRALADLLASDLVASGICQLLSRIRPWHRC